MDTRYPPYPAYKPSGVAWLGEIPSHWEVRRLKYMCWRSAVYGANEPASNYSSEGVRFLRTTDIDDFGNLLDTSPIYLQRDAVRDYLLDDGDLLLSRSGTIGRSFLYSREKHGECAYAGYLVRFSLRKEYWPKYVFYFTKSAAFYDWLGLSVIQSTIGNVNGQKYANLHIPLPPLPEQRAIAAYLDRQTAHIDALIAKKRELIDLLERQRTALIGHAVTKGLNPAAPLKPSGVPWLGEIPSHWEVRRLKYMCWRSAVYGANEPASNYSSEGVRFLRTTDIDDFGNLIDTSPIYLQRDAVQDYLLDDGDLLLSRSGTIGRSFLYSREKHGECAYAGSFAHFCSRLAQ